MLTAVLSPVTGVLLLWLGGPVLLGIQRQSAGVLDQLDRLHVFIIYALFYTGPPALLLAAFGASVLFGLSARGLPRRVVLLTGSVLGAVAGLVALPPPGHHLLDVVPPIKPFAVVAIINGALWGLVVAGYAFQQTLRLPRAR
jgi:hypothetical protein